VALRQAEVLAGAGDPPGWHWVACDSCQAWRLITGSAYYEMRLDNPDSKFYCGENMDRLGWGRGCEDPAEWVAAGGEGE